MREKIILKVWLWRMVLDAAITWCRFTRWLHGRSDDLCGWLARKAAGDLLIQKEAVCSESGIASK
jgi:hypothetical protein